MDCRRYEKWLTDAALEALNPARKRQLDAHLAGCAACRAQLERERKLVASIDASLAQSLDAQLPAGFAARVRARLVEEAATERSWLAGWTPLVAGALAVALLAIVGWVSWRTVPVRRQAAVSARQRAGSRIQDSGFRIQEPGVRNQKAEGRHQKRLARRHSGDTGLQVLVDKSQWQAILTLYNEAQSRRIEVGSLVAKHDEDADAPVKPIEIKRLEVPPLSSDLKPLDSGGAQ